MKVTTDHIDVLRTAIGPIDTTDTRAAYRDGRFPRAELVKDINKRYRWDLLWASGAAPVLYDSGYTDAHIDTALRSIVPPL